MPGNQIATYVVKKQDTQKCEVSSGLNPIIGFKKVADTRTAGIKQL